MRNTLILLVLGLALGAYVYFYEYKGEESRQKEKEAAEKLIPLEADSIQAFDVLNAGSRYRFEKEGDNWRISQPVKTDAEQSVVESYLRTLTGAKKVRTVHVAGKDLPNFGLKTPRARVHVQSRAGRNDSLWIGAPTSFGGNIFVSKGDTVVFTTGQNLWTQTNKHLFDWRDKRVVHFDKESVKRFTLRNPRGDFEFEKENGTWHVRKPLDTKADDAAVRAVLNKLDFGRILDVTAESASSLKAYKLDQPNWRVELFTGENQARSGVSFSKPTGKTVYGKDDVRPHIFKVDTLFTAPLNKGLYGYRDKKLADFGTGNITRIMLENGGVSMEFKKDSASQWIRVGDTNAVKSFKITGLLNAVRGLKAASFVSEQGGNLRRYGLDKPRAVLELWAGDGLVARYAFGNRRGKQRYVHIPSTGQIVTVKEKDLDDILLTPDDMMKKK
ncbi:MAG: DUF4340 domain-containing protein [Calditrichaeota bacterium]|nr:MAG: DUF4340 domain-containing protein [Calditrichota bacterium]